MSLLRKLRRNFDRINSIKSNRAVLEQLEPRLLLNADLAVTEFGFDDTLSAPPFHWGDSINLATDIFNYGDVDSGAFDVQVALSQDNALDGSDMILHTGTANSIAAGGDDIYDPVVTLPNNGLTDGDYYLIFSADINEATGDTNLTNNVHSSPIFIGDDGHGGDPPPEDPDLYISNFNAGGPFIIGQSFNVTNEVHNPTGTTANSFNVNIVLSPDANIDASDTVLSSRNISALGADGRSQEQTMVSLPDDGSVMAGVYYLGIIADPNNQITEFDENNNTASFQVQVEEEQAQIDVQPSNLSWAQDAVIVTGGTFDVNTSVTNNGTDPADNFTMRIGFSATNDFSGGYEVLSEWVVGNIPGQGNDTQNKTINVPDGLTEGDYYLALIADTNNNLEETNEGNNILSTGIFISDGNVPGDIELQPQNFALTNTDPIIWGTSLNLEADVINTGTMDSGNFDVAIYLSQDNVIDGSDNLLHTLAINSLAPGAVSANNINVSLPAAGTDGNYQLIIAVDSGQIVDELSEDDNTWALSIQIADNTPTGNAELQPVNFHIDTNTPLDWGSTVAVNTDIQNAGNLDAGEFAVSVYLSLDNVIDGSDSILHSFTITSLAAGVNSPHNFDVTLPAAGTDGDYNLILEVDSGQVIDELNEDDNVWTTPIHIEEQIINNDIELQISGFNTDTSAPFNWGGTVNVDTTIDNIGSADAGEFAVSVYLSPDNAIDLSDSMLHSFTITSLAAGANSPHNFDVTLPAAGADGDYNLIIEIDSAHVIDEPSEDNNVSSVVIHIGQDIPDDGDDEIDLIPDEAFLPPFDLVWGQQYEIPVDVDNMGGAASGAFTTTIVLSENNTFGDADDYHLLDVEFSAGVSGWNSSFQDVMITLPAADTLPDGDYQIIMFVDSANVVAETDENNNICMDLAHISSTANLISGIDLEAAEFNDNEPNGFTWGSTYEFDADIFNKGDTDAGAFAISIVLSVDDSYDGSDTVIGSATVSSLASNSVSINDVNVTLPVVDDGFSDGQYYFILMADSGNAVTEADENNNTLSFMAMIDQGGGDPPVDDEQIELQPDVFAFTTTDPLNWGMTVNMDANVRNAGTADAGVFDVTIYLSEDNIVDQADNALYTFTINSLAAGSLASNNIDITLPAAGTDGEYNLIMVVDSGDEIVETNEEDNCWSTLAYIGEDNPPQDDIELQAGIININNQTTINWGDILNIDTEIFNTGNSTPDPFTVSISLSQDNIPDDTDTVLHSFSIDSLPGGSSTAQNLDINLPAAGTDGDYHLIMMVDSGNVVPEPNEDDNITMVTIHVGADNPDDPPVSEDGIDLIADDNVDFQFPYDPVWGQEIDIPVNVFNNGDTASGSFNATVVLSQNNVYGDNDDHFLTDVTFANGVEPGMGDFTDAMVTLPAIGTLADGDYHFLVFLDSTNAVTETDENNNIAILPATITSTPNLDPGIDLLVTEFGPNTPTDTFDWGIGYQFAVDIYNGGDSDAGAFTINIALSDDSHFDGGDTILVTESVSALAAGSMSENDIMVTLPDADQLADGSYHLILIADSESVITETDENNNTVEFMLQIGTGVEEPPIEDDQPELQPSTFFVNIQDGVNWGDTINIDAEVTNTGMVESGAFTVSVYISEDDFIDGTDTELHSFTINSLVAGANYPSNFDITLPASGTDGQFNFILEVDSGHVINEPNEEDNIWSQPIFVGDDGPIDDPDDGGIEGIDLVIDNDPNNMIPFDFIWGQQYEMSVDVFNEGNTAIGAFTTSIILSSNDIYGDDDDYHLADADFSNGIQPFSGDFRDIMITLPAVGTLADGTYHIITFADSGEVVNEVDENNNIGLETVNILSTPSLISGVDLKAIEFDDDADGDIQWGQSFPVAADVYNEGDTDSGAFTISIALSDDAQYDANDTVVGTTQIASLASAAMSINDITITLPDGDGRQDGCYYLVMWIDSENDVTEADESNNYGSMELFIGDFNDDNPIEQADLVADEIGMPDGIDLIWEQTYEIPVDVFNNSNVEAGPFTISVVLSQDEIYDPATDTTLAEIQSNGIAPWGESINDVFITLPKSKNQTDGIHYLMIVADSHKVVLEKDELNNISIEQVNIVSPDNLEEGVDLQIIEFGLDDETLADFMEWGFGYDMYVDIYNAGDTNAEDFTVALAISDDINYDVTDIEIGQFQIPSLTAGAISENDIFINLPAANLLAEGTWYLVAAVDSFMNVTETKETNNSAFIEAYIGGGDDGDLPAGIDLGIPFVESPADAGFGDEIAVTYGLENFGGTDAANVTVQFLLSHDPFISDDDLSLGEQIIDSVLSTEFSEQTITLTLPDDTEIGAGFYHIIARADAGDGVTEEFIDNNIGVGFINIMGSGNDLTFTDMFMPFDAQWGDTISIDAQIENRGSSPAGPFDVSFYILSESESPWEINWTLDPQATPEATYTVDTINDGTMTTISVDITLPDNNESDGILRILGFVDAGEAIDEYDEMNNMWWQDVFVGTPEQANLEAWPMVMFDPQQDQDNFDWQETINVDTWMNNSSNATTGAFSITYYLSTDEMHDDGDIELSTVEISGLQPFENRNETSSLTLPADPGIETQQWFLLSYIDSGQVINEFNEDDNIGWSDIFIGSKPADLVGWLHVAVGDNQSVQWGSVVTLEGEIENIGGTDAGEFTVAYYVTDNPENIENETPLTTQTISSLAAEARTNVLESITLPDEPTGDDGDTTYIVAIIDPDNLVPETDDWNNFMGSWLTTDIAAPDMAAFWADAGINASWGDPITIDFELGNMGTIDAANFTVDFYLGRHDNDLQNAFPLGNIIIDNISPQEAYESTITVTLPQPDEVNFVDPNQTDGTYMIMMVIDAANTIEEIVEENNMFMMPLRLEAKQAMIEVTDSVNDAFDWNLDMGTILIGETITESFTIANRGEGNLNIHQVNWNNDKFTITLDGNPVNDIAEFASLALNESLTFEVTFAADDPGLAEGNIEIFTDAPGQNAVNLWLRAEVAEQPIDLSFHSISGPSSANWGDDINLTLDIRNLEAGSVDSAEYEIILADSPDPDVNGNMMVLWNQQVNEIAANGKVTEKITLTLPEVSPFGYGGEMYLLAHIRPTGNAFEENFENNEAFTTIEISSNSYGNPDLTFSWFWVPPDITPDENFDIALSVQNMGTADAGAFNISYYLSQDDIPDENDTVLDQSSFLGLSAQMESLDERTLTLPDNLEEGLYHLLARIDTDDNIDEENEENNLAVARFNIGENQTIDLIADYVTVANEAIIGDEFVLDFQVTNASAEPVEDVRVEFFLSEANQNDDSFGFYIGSTIIENINAEESIALVHQSVMPNGIIDVGENYFIRIFVDADHRYFEEDEENNINISVDPMTAVVGDVDLTSAVIGAPTEAKWFEEITFDISISNNGNYPASPFYADILVSTDQTSDDSDFYLNSVIINQLPAGGNSTFNLSVLLPESLAGGDGDYYLLVDADSDNIIVETDETNNTASSLITISGKSDLAISIDELPAAGKQDQTISITDHIENQGISLAENINVSYYLSIDSEFDLDEDTLLTPTVARTIASLAPNSQNSTTTQLTIPADIEEGRYYLLAIVDPDNDIDEMNEYQLPAGELQANNLDFRELHILDTGMPDLKVSELTTVETSDWGETIAVNYTIDNIGTAEADAFNLTFYLSNNASITNQDILLWKTDGTGDPISTIIEIDALTSNNNTSGLVTLLLPEENPYGENGDFYIGVMVDSSAAIAEADEDNNVYAPEETITIGTVATVDLMAVHINAPAAAEPDQTIDIYSEIYNSGSTAAGSFDIDFYLTSDGTIDASDILIGSRTIDELGAGAFDSITTSLTLPASLSDSYGQSFVIAMEMNASQAIEEKTYNNNQIAAFSSLTITEPVQFDTAATNLTSETEANWGDSITVQYELSNAFGDANLSVPVGFYLSRNGTPDTTNLLAQISIDSSSANVSGETTLTLPTQSPYGRDGDFEIVLIADPYYTLIESNENNNFASSSISIGSGMADLVALSISGIPQAAAGDSFTVYNDLENVGSVATTTFDVYFYLTETNSEVDITNDTGLGMRQVTALNPAEVNWNITSLTIPGSGVDDGDYYLAMVVDRFDDITETSETNNTIFSARPIKIRTINVSPDSNEPNNNTGMATSITLDDDGQMDLISASLHNSEDLDYYQMAIPADSDGYGQITVLPDETLNVSLAVYNSSGNMIGGADFDPEMGGEEIFTIFSLVPGRTYTILVKPGGDSLGNYTMDMEVGIGTVGDSYESNDTIDTAHPLGTANTDIEDASIHNGTDIDYYQFMIPATSTGQVNASLNPDFNLDAILQIFDEDGILVTSSDGGGAGSAESIAFDAVVGDIYYAKVSAWAQSTGTYEFNLSFTKSQMSDAYETNDDIVSAYDMGDSEFSLVDPGIHSVSDIDYYALTVPEGQSNVEVYLFVSAGLNGSLSLYDADGNLLRSAEREGVNGTELLLAGDLTAHQQLYLAVSGAENTTGTYGLEVSYGNDVVGDAAEPNEQTATAFPLIIDNGSANLINLSIHDSEDRDYFSFTAPDLTDGTAIIIVRPQASEELDVSLRLLNSVGTTVASTDSTGAGENESLSLSSGLVAGETYYIDINGWGSQGAYELEVQTPLAGAAAGPPTPDEGPQVAYRPHAWGLTNTGYLADGTPPEIVIIEEVGNVNDDDLSFGTSPADTSISYEVVVLNTGGSQLDISEAAISGTDAGMFSITPTDAQIEAGQSQIFTVTFAPTTLGYYSDASLTFTSNDSDEGTYDLTLSGTATVSSSKPNINILDVNSQAMDTLLFDDTLTDSSESVSFLIANDGAAALTVTSATLSGDGASAFEIVQTNLANKSSDDYQISAAGQRTITIQFSPSTSGTYDASLTLTSNDPNESTVIIPISADAVEPDLVVDITPDDGTLANAIEPEIAFGQQTNDGTGGQTGIYPITISNPGTSTLTISSISFGLGAASPYSITGDGISTDGFTIAAGESLSASVIFDPASNGLHPDTMTINSNDPDSSVFQFALSGQAVMAYTYDLEAKGTFSFTDADGDTVMITFGSAGEGTITFDGTTADGSDIETITIENSSKKTTLTITVTPSENSNGQVDIGDIFVTGSGCGTIEITGNVESMDIEGATKTINISGSLGGLDVEGIVTTLTAGSLTGEITAEAIKSLIVTGDIDSAQITTDGAKNPYIKTLTVGGSIANNTTIETSSIKNMTVAEGISDTIITITGTKGQLATAAIGGDVDNLTLTTASLKTINVDGDADMDITATGAIKSIITSGNLSGQISSTGVKGQINTISVGEDLTADLTAYKSIKTVNVNGSINASQILINGTGKGSLKTISAGGDINVSNMNVDGAIKSITAGTTDNTGDLIGAITAASSIKSVTVHGDINADITATGKISKVTADGSLLKDADIISTGSNIDKVLLGEDIYGTLSANGGNGQIKQIQYDEAINGITDSVDSLLQHITANLAKTKRIRI